MKKFSLFLSFLVSIIISSCGSSEEFRIAGVIDGMGTQNIYINYYTSGKLQQQNAIVLDGKFSVVGKAQEPTIVEIHSSDNALLAMLMVENGETVDCKIEKNNRYKISFDGNGVSSRLGKFLTENADVFASRDVDKKNELIAQYVVKHPDDMTSTVLMLTEYYTPENEVMADSLLNMISEEARPFYLVEGYATMLARVNSDISREKIRPMNLYCSDDTLYSYNPSKASYSVLSFTDENQDARDTIVPEFKTWSKKYASRRLNIVDVSFAIDTLTWHNVIDGDEASWTQCWVLGSVQAKQLERLVIPRTPYFIVVDSTGEQLYRGSLVSRVAKIIDGNLK